MAAADTKETDTKTQAAAADMKEPQVSFEEWKKLEKKKARKAKKGNTAIDMADTVAISLCLLLVPLIVALVYVHVTGWKFRGDRDSDAPPKFETMAMVAEREGLLLNADRDGDSIVLTSDNFPAIVLQTVSTLAVFTVPGHEASEAFRSTWQKVADKYATSRNVRIVKVNCEEQVGICTMYDISDLPTLKYWEDGFRNSNPETYEGNRDAESIVSFVAETLDVHHLPKGEDPRDKKSTKPKEL